MHRHKIELLAPADYLEMDYFEKWAVATAELVKDAGLASESELRTGQVEFEVDLVAHPPIGPGELVDAMRSGVQLSYPDHEKPAAFLVGDTIRVTSNSTPGHTRVPRYVRSKTGTVVADHGPFQFADTVARGDGPCPQHCYTVMFRAEILWGTGAESAEDLVYLDLAEAYLERP